VWVWVFVTVIVNVVIHEIYYYTRVVGSRYNDSIVADSTDKLHSNTVATIGESGTTVMEVRKSVNDDKNVNNNSNIIYGHLHIPKTGGTTLNGLMAARYERVCGNKGYTFDAYQANIRAFEAGKENFQEKGSGKAWDYKPGVLGYENCDYISNEIKWNFWHGTLQTLNTALEPFESIADQANPPKKKAAYKEDAPPPLTMELHVPCRDPIDHMLSMANHEGTIIKRVIFNCTGVETDDALLEREVDRAYFDLNRFNANLDSKNIKLKCFQSIPVEPYIEYMDQFLQTRRIPSEYYHHKTNDKRDKSKECVRNLPEKVKQKIRGILMKNHPYMKFCNECMGSKKQIQLQ